MLAVNLEASIIKHTLRKHTLREHTLRKHTLRKPTLRKQLTLKQTLVNTAVPLIASQLVRLHTDAHPVWQYIQINLEDSDAGCKEPAHCHCGAYNV